MAMFSKQRTSFQRKKQAVCVEKMERLQVNHQKHMQMQTYADADICRY